MNIFSFHKKEASDTPKGAKDISVQWGGYYAQKTHNGYGVIRLLDFYQTAYHVQTFAHTFDHVPTQDEVSTLKPTVAHAVRNTEELLQHDMTLVGQIVLTAEDLAGYSNYLETNGYEQVEIDKINERVILFSQGAPAKVRLALVNGAITVTTLN